ncbi:hypothetical protein [Rhodococcus gannanensis]|uniref:Uncharacterized protein n=1 Tax=Rhodococcus gannanensis TaxID=1960308 RepID=A0ABW4PBN2_9NOCA
MSTVRRTVELLTALLVGTVAGWALVTPPASGIAGSEGQMKALVTSGQVAAAVGVLAAAAVAGRLSGRRSARGAGLTTLVGLGLLVAVQYANDGALQFEWLLAATWVWGIAAGVALGGAAAAASDRIGTVLLTGSAVAAFVVVPLATELLGTSPERGWTAYNPLTDVVTVAAAPIWWLLLPAVVATAFAVALGGTRTAGRSTRGLAVTAAVVATALATNAAIGATLDNRPLAAVLLAVFVAVTIASAFALDGQDGTLLLTTTAVVAAAAPLSGWSDTSWIGVAILAAGLAVGVAVGARWPSVVVGLTLLATVSVAGFLPDLTDGMNDAARWLILAPIAGYAVGSCDPVRSGSLVAGLSVLFVPSALTVAGQAAPGVFADLWPSPFRSLSRGMTASLPPDPQWLTVAMTAVGLVTIAAAGVLRQRDDS